MRKTPLSLSLFCINENNNLNLPRQARDNHRENSEKRDDAFVSFAGALWDIYETRKDAIYGDEADDSITIRNPNSKFSVRERVSLIHLRHFVLKMIIILPRQARDKHEESSTEKKDVFLQVAWDVLSVFLLLYVTSSVPVRACFGVPDVLWTAAFWFDVFVDLYFVADIGAEKRA